MLIKSKDQLNTWFHYTDDDVTVICGKDRIAWTWSMFDRMIRELGLLPSVKQELTRYAEAYRILRKTPEKERTGNWKGMMAKIMGTTYGDLQKRIKVGEIVWEEKA